MAASSSALLACAALALLAHGTQGFALSTTLPGRMTKVCAAAAAVPRLRPQIGAGRRAAASPALRMQFGLGNLFGGGGGGAKGKVVSLEEAGVVPDIIAEPFESKTVLRVKYPAWVKSAVDLTDVSSFGGTPTRGAGEIGMGQVITPTQAQTAPVVGWEAEPGAFYTLVLTDPDAPSRASPTLREWVHWVRVNIPGDNLPCDGEDGGDDLKTYVGAGPPASTGLHRYVFLLYKQPNGKQTFEDADRTPFVKNGRDKWSASKFAEKYGLGAPIAWSYFEAEFDNFVLELNSLLAGEKA